MSTWTPTAQPALSPRPLLLLLPRTDEVELHQNQAVHHGARQCTTPIVQSTVHTAPRGPAPPRMMRSSARERTAMRHKDESGITSDAGMGRAQHDDGSDCIQPRPLTQLAPSACNMPCPRAVQRVEGQEEPHSCTMHGSSKKRGATPPGGLPCGFPLRAVGGSPAGVACVRAGAMHVAVAAPMQQCARGA